MPFLKIINELFEFLPEKIIFFILVYLEEIIIIYL